MGCPRKRVNSKQRDCFSIGHRASELGQNIGKLRRVSFRQSTIQWPIHTGVSLETRTSLIPRAADRDRTEERSQCATPIVLDAFGLAANGALPAHFGLEGDLISDDVPLDVVEQRRCIQQGQTNLLWSQAFSLALEPSYVALVQHRMLVSALKAKNPLHGGPSRGRFQTPTRTKPTATLPENCVASSSRLMP